MNYNHFLPWFYNFHTINFDIGYLLYLWKKHVDSRQTSCVATPFNTSCLVFSFYGNYKLITKWNDFCLLQFIKKILFYEVHWTRKPFFAYPALDFKKKFVNKNVLNGVAIHVFTASKHVFFQRYDPFTTHLIEPWGYLPKRRALALVIKNIPKDNFWKIKKILFEKWRKSFSSFSRLW